MRKAVIDGKVRYFAFGCNRCGMIPEFWLGDYYHVILGLAAISTMNMRIKCIEDTNRSLPCIKQIMHYFYIRAVPCGNLTFTVVPS